MSFIIAGPIICAQEKAREIERKKREVKKIKEQVQKEKIDYMKNGLKKRDKKAAIIKELKTYNKYVYYAFLKSDLSIDDLGSLMETLNGYEEKFKKTVGIENYNKLPLKENISLEAMIALNKIKKLSKDYYMNPMEVNNELVLKTNRQNKLNRELKKAEMDLNELPRLSKLCCFGKINDIQNRIDKLDSYLNYNTKVINLLNKITPYTSKLVEVSNAYLLKQKMTKENYANDKDIKFEK